jgi:hypothetical protein
MAMLRGFISLIAALFEVLRPNLNQAALVPGTFVGGSNALIQAYYHSYPYSNWYFVGQCQVQNATIGMNGEWVWTGG